MSFVILLPEHPQGITYLENNLTVDHLVDYKKAFQMMPGVDVMLSLPRFKLEDSFDLGDSLAKQGMPDLFNDKADLSGIDGKKQLFVSKVIHKSFIEVNEEGSEAAAATSMGYAIKSLPRVFNFVADHPFLFFIMDDVTGSIVFLGKFAHPS